MMWPQLTKLNGVYSEAILRAGARMEHKSSAVVGNRGLTAAVVRITRASMAGLSASPETSPMFKAMDAAARSPTSHQL